MTKDYTISRLTRICECTSRPCSRAKASRQPEPGYKEEGLEERKSTYKNRMIRPKISTSLRGQHNRVGEESREHSENGATMAFREGSKMNHESRGEVPI